MKALVLALALTFSTAVLAAETKRVCITQTDQKTGKPKQVCKDVKIHKKLDGTPVPPKK